MQNGQERGSCFTTNIMGYQGFKQQCAPIKDWMLKTKMNTKKIVSKVEFRQIFGTWLTEYDEIDDLHRVIPAELGQFFIDKTNNKALDTCLIIMDRVWKHLDETGSGRIKRDQILDMLQWMAVLYVTYRFRV